jgi:hypothetical protein
MWIHFESFHIIQQPTYMSKYPPAQGLMLAIGQLIAGHPIVGVWISFGLMCAAICWMLYGWVSPHWAILGGVFAMINPTLGIAGYWAQSYWGGAVAATGGALVLGGVRRLMRYPHIHDSLFLGIGLAVLANSRPFEGLLVSLPAGIFLFIHVIKQRGFILWISVKRIVLPILLVLAVTTIGMGFYNLRVTGDPFRMPYQIHEETYGMAPIFLWQKPRLQTEYRHKVIRDFHATYELPLYRSQQSISGFLLETAYLSAWGLLIINIFLVPIIIACRVLLLWTLRDPWARRALLIYFVLGLGLVTETFKWPHYAAPISALNYYFVVNALRLTQWQNRKIGQLMLWLTPLLAIAALVVISYGAINSDNSSAWHEQRAQLLKRLKQKDGEHLVIVNYGPKHSFHNEWVYNEADIDHSKVVFARAINTTQDCRLLEYFKSRRMWSLEIDDDQSIPELKPYPLSLCK